MKVEFSLEEVQVMAEAILDAMAEADLGKRDQAALKRWRAEEFASTSAAMKRLTERINDDLQRTHDDSQVSPIRKPDWA